ncbi:flavin-containing monooxygenase-like protein [Leptotrombidium deliense]|uniref:Flavin-containing monooxygenase n=1 Tax=Leptotrombidium deliense TaxID=299467 RepID=A0A443RXP9_9ACAR|nr:flavin-containing monooxygenase-like protein [Leptotrombidium deliense]
MQSRWFAQLTKGDQKLPTKQEMLSEIEKDIKAINDRYYASKRHPIQVEYIPFMDKLTYGSQSVGRST